MNIGRKVQDIRYMVDPGKQVRVQIPRKESSWGKLPTVKDGWRSQAK